MAGKQYNRIKAVLAEKEKTGIDLAQSLGVHEQTVSAWSTNKKQPSVERLFEIAAILNVEAGELLTQRRNLKG